MEGINSLRIFYGTNGTIEVASCKHDNIMSELKFDNLLGAKLLLEDGPNIHQVEQNKQPGYLDLGKNVNTVK